MWSETVDCTRAGRESSSLQKRMKPPKERGFVGKAGFCDETVSPGKLVDQTGFIGTFLKLDQLDHLKRKNEIENSLKFPTNIFQTLQSLNCTFPRRFYAQNEHYGSHLRQCTAKGARLKVVKNSLPPNKIKLQKFYQTKFFFS